MLSSRRAWLANVCLSLLASTVVAACAPNDEDDAGPGGKDGGALPQDAGADGGGRLDAGPSDGGSDAGRDDGGEPDGGPIDGGADGGSDGGTPSGDDRFSIGTGGVVVDYYEAVEVGAPGGLDPAIDSFFDGQGRVAFGNVITFAADAEEGAPHTRTARLTFSSVVPGGSFINTGTASARIEDETGVWVSDAGGLTSGLINVTRLDTRVVGTFSLTLCLAEEVLAGHCDGGTKTYTGSFDLGRSPGHLPKPDLVLAITELEYDAATGEIAVELEVTNQGTAPFPAEVSLDLATWRDTDVPPATDPDSIYDDIELDEPLLPGQSHTFLWITVGVEHGGRLYYQLNYEGNVEELQLGNNGAYRRYGGTEAELEVTIDSLQHERGVMIVDFTITNPSPQAYIADPLQPLDFVKLYFYPDLAAPPTSANIPRASVGMRPLLPAYEGRYSSRAAFFVGPTPTSGEAWITLASGTSPQRYDDAIGPSEWTGSFFDYDTVSLGSAEEPLHIGTAPIRFVGQLQREAWLAYTVPPGVDDVLVRITGTNNLASLVPGSTVYRGSEVSGITCTSTLGAVQQSCTYATNGETTGVLELALPPGLSGPTQGSSFHLEILPIRMASLRVTVDDAFVDEDVPRYLRVRYTVYNDEGFDDIPADVVVPVYLWTHLEDPAPLRLDVAEAADAVRGPLTTADGVDFITGGLPSGGERTSSYNFDLESSRPYARYRRGQAYAYVAPFHESAPSCSGLCADLRTPIGEANWEDNLSLPDEWGDPDADVAIQATGTYVYRPEGAPAGVVFELTAFDNLPPGLSTFCYEVAWHPNYVEDEPYLADDLILCGPVEYGAPLDRVHLRYIAYGIGSGGRARFWIDPADTRRDDDTDDNQSNYLPWKGP